MELTPIETVYNGYRFRSRLEARWAVFFDHLDIDYRYEPEGFDLDGTWYLPDFYLPDLATWIEVKGSRPTDDELELGCSLAAAAGQEVFIVWGECRQPESWDEPDARWGILECTDFGAGEGNTWWARCTNCGRRGLAFEGDPINLGCCRGVTRGDSGRDDILIQDAYRAALQARFAQGAP